MKECTICEKPLESDFTPHSCQMCGMNLHEKKITKEIDERTLHFCCENCLEKYKSINFKNKKQTR